MWKLVKSELSYWRLPILGCYAFFTFLAFALYVIVTRYIGVVFMGFETLIGIEFWTVSIHVILTVVVLGLEIKELRLRRIAVLPVRNLDVGNARLVTPFFLLLIYVLLGLMTVLLMLALFPAGTFTYVKYVQATTYPPSTIPEIIWGHLEILAVWFFLVYAIRLFSEWQGRILLLCSFALLVFYAAVLPFFKAGLYTSITLQLENAVAAPQGAFVFTFLGIVLVCLIQLFFIQRRSYLQ